MKRRVYLDTTVPSAYYDDRAPDRQRLTEQFWLDTLPEFSAVVSNLVLLEIRDTPDEARRAKMQGLIRDCEVLSFDLPSDELAQEYVKRGIFPARYETDARHVAVAVTNGIGYIVSWNFTHLVKVRTKREVNLVNALMGYEAVEIIAPPEL